MSNLAEVVGLKIRCPATRRIVSIARDDYAIGPISEPHRNYVVRCKCGKIHKIPTRSVSKPTRSQCATPRS